MYKKIDLHIHSPYSSCYLDHVMPEANLRTSPQDIVSAAVAASLEAIAITDHNTVEAIDSIRQIGKSNGLCVLPGIELSARGGHVLAIFEQDTPTPKLRHLLQLLGFEKEQQGQGFCETSCWMDEVFEIIEENGGLAIAAHMDRKPKGFIASDELEIEDKRRIHGNNHLSALEITLPQNKLLWNRGLVPGYPPKHACIQGSDAHSPSEVGRRPIYIEIPTINLDGLRLAFNEYESRIRFPEELVPEHNPHQLSTLPP